jgi:hypothetical protein
VKYQFKQNQVAYILRECKSKSEFYKISYFCNAPKFIKYVLYTAELIIHCNFELENIIE